MGSGTRKRKEKEELEEWGELTKKLFHCAKKGTLDTYFPDETLSEKTLGELKNECEDDQIVGKINQIIQENIQDGKVINTENISISPNEGSFDKMNKYKKITEGTAGMVEDVRKWIDYQVKYGGKAFLTLPCPAMKELLGLLYE